jgi:DNA-directed RNA polymerase subunit RPC12/RpoP
MYCPVCYLELTVPAESTIKPVDESQLYAADSTPLDVRTMNNRKKQVSLRCSICHTNIAVTKEQIGTEISCPECETKIVVPASIAQKVEEAFDDPSAKMLSGSHSSGKENSGKETYGLFSESSQSSVTENIRGNIRVYCKLCGTMMYASDLQVGTELTCPDCETKTVVPPRPKVIPLPPPLPTTFEGNTVFGVTENSETTTTTTTPEAGLLVPVVCSLCATRMYARESEIGGFKTCPDCGRQNEIKAVATSERVPPVLISGGGYTVDASQIPATRPTFRTLTDYRYVDGSLDKELYETKKPEPKFSRPLSIFPILDNTDATSTTETNKVSDSNESNESNESSESDAVRERQALKKAGFNAASISLQHLERTPLPKFPFWTRIFVPFLYFELLVLTVLSSFFCSAGLIVAIILPIYWVMFSAPFGLIFFSLGISLLANTAHSVFLWTTSGNDLPEKDDWQEFRLLESGSFAIWLFLLAILAASPGYLLASSFPATSASPEQTIEIPLVSFLLGIFSLFVFFPIFFLSSMESNSYFMILAKGTCCSLFRCTGIWLRFYAVSFLLAAIFCAIIGLVLFFVQNNVLAGLAVVFSIGSVFSILYARFLGRLGWALEESSVSEDGDECT